MPRESEKDVRLDEIDRYGKELSWINSINDFLSLRRKVLEEKTPNVEFQAKDARLNEIDILEKLGFDVHPVRVYIGRRREELSAL